MIPDYKIVPFRRWHVDWLLEDGDAEGGFFRPDQGTLQCMESMANNWTILLGANPLLCGGTLEQWPGRHIAWAYLNKHTGRHMAFVTRKAYEYIRRANGRIEFTVRKDFEPGHRWAKMLGFEVETPLLKAWGPEGEDHVGYVLINR